MDKDLKLFYYVLLTGENKITPKSNLNYEMETRVDNGSLISACNIGFSFNNEFTIWKGLETFRWHFSKHIRV